MAKKISIDLSIAKTLQIYHKFPWNTLSLKSETSDKKSARSKMNLDTYNLKTNSDQEIFEFESIGTKGTIQKLVLFKETSFSGIYNLGFGDIDPETGNIDDKIVSDNGDGEIVLSTVVSTIHKFFDKHPNAQVYLSGSTKSRTRLYRIAINKYIELFSSKFEIMGELETHFERFRKDAEYEGYLIKLK